MKTVLIGLIAGICAFAASSSIWELLSPPMAPIVPLARLVIIDPVVPTVVAPEAESVSIEAVAIEPAPIAVAAEVPPEPECTEDLVVQQPAPTPPSDDFAEKCALATKAIDSFRLQVPPMTEAIVQLAPSGDQLPAQRRVAVAVLPIPRSTTPRMVPRTSFTRIARASTTATPRQVDPFAIGTTDSLLRASEAIKRLSKKLGWRNVG